MVSYFVVLIDLFHLVHILPVLSSAAALAHPVSGSQGEVQSIL